MARVLIVGCGCRGRALARALIDDGHSVTGTTRRPHAVPLIEGVGADGFVGDPDRLLTLLPAVDGVGVVFWLLGSAEGSPEAVADVHGPRLSSFVERLVDTPVRGFVYEATGSVAPGVLEAGTEIARDAAARWRLPVELIETPADDHDAWLADARGAVARVLRL